MLYAQCVGSHPLKPPSSQATRSHPEKAKNYEPKALNETMLPMRRKKVSLFHTPSTWPHQFPTPFQPKKKNRDVRKRGDPLQEQEKVNKGKKQEES